MLTNASSGTFGFQLLEMLSRLVADHCFIALAFFWAKSVLCIKQGGTTVPKESAVVSGILVRKEET